jgi:hypothetical protein
VHVFISYRRSDTPSASRQLADALKLRFGSDRVFFDTRDVAAGTEWRSDTVGRVQESDVVLVVIGPHWATAAEERVHRSVLDPEAEDVVRLEIETAFMRRRIVIPVLVDDAEMPLRETLPRPFRPLADVQAQTLHHASWDRDLEALVEALVHLGTGSRTWEAPPAPPPERRVGATRSDPERVARYIGDGRVVTVVGCGTHGLGPDPESLPNTIELVRRLVRRFGIGSEEDDLARVSQHVMLIDGKADLYRALRELLIKVDGEPGSVHRFVARVPARLRDADRERYQLLITTNYDTALERAFDAVHEPYDLVVFVAGGEHRGRFVHIPWWDLDGDGARLITVPNEYVDLPIDESGALERTVIVKLHGGGAELGSYVRDAFVITEDDYIGYLTLGPVESLVPLQILNKIRESHFLFLGYRLRDWGLRVFLQRVWGDQPLEARSWAVNPEADLVERGLWQHLGVSVVDSLLTEFTEEVDRELVRLAHVHARG